jgi:hypothetical protein
MNVCMYVYMYVYAHMPVCVYVDICIYDSVSVSVFNQMQILTNLDTMLRHCWTHKGKIFFRKKEKSDGVRNFLVGEKK